MIACLIPIFTVGIPLLVGLRLWRQRDTAGFAQFAAALTLKPLITTLPWFLIASRSGASNAPNLTVALVSVLPGAGLTLLIFLMFSGVLFGSYSKRAWVLLGLDCLRWSNSFLIALTGSVYIYQPTGSLVHAFALLGILFPAVFAGIAAMLTNSIGLELPACPHCGQLLQLIDGGQVAGDSRQRFTPSSRAQTLLTKGYVWVCESCQQGWTAFDIS